MKRKRYSSLERTAYHEAGHAVAGYLLHWRFTRVSIVPDQDSLGRCSYARLSENFTPDAHVDRPVRAKLEKMIMGAQAGAIAELLLTGRIPAHWGESPDATAAVDYASYVAGGDDETFAYTNWLWERTKNLLWFEANWESVKAVAMVLLDERQIGERRARAVIAEAQRA